MIDKETLYEEPERHKDRQRDGEIEGRRRRYIGRDCRIGYYRGCQKFRETKRETMR